MKKVYNLPFEHSFISEITKHILSKHYQTQEELANLIIIMPNDRSIVNLQNKLLEYTQKSAIILPKIISINNINYFFDNLDISNISEDGKNQLSKRVISTNTRLYMLSRILQEKFAYLSVYQSFVLANELATIIDKSYYENVDLSKISTVYIDNIISEHWKTHISFLPVIYNLWKEILENLNAIDTMQRKNLIYQIQAAQIITTDKYILSLNIISKSPYILNLLNSIYKSQNGNLYFYGIDKNILTQKDLQESHPQYELNNAIKTLKVKQDDIVDLQPATFKQQIIHRLFDDKITTSFDGASIKEFFNNISIIKSSNENEEAKAIALLVKENLHTTNKQIGIISNDTNTIFRINTELKRWNINVTNYVGEALHNVKANDFIMLIINVVVTNFDPHLLLSLLKHPYFNLGYDQEEINNYINVIDLYILRDNILQTSTNNLENIINTYNSLRKSKILSLHDDSFIASFDVFLEDLKASFQDIVDDINRANNFKSILIKHITLSEKLAYKTDDICKLWENQEGKELSMFFSNLLEETDIIEKCTLEDYLHILTFMMNNINIFNPEQGNNRVYLYNSLLSNLMHHDIVIIANLNEGIIPFENKGSPWLNKYICKQINLSTFNQQLGIQSNYFCQYLGSSKVILSRSEKVNNKVNSPSRFLLLITTLADCYNIPNDTLYNKNYILDLTRIIDTSSGIQHNNIKVDSPSIVVPDNRLPNTIFATHLETLNKNPYEFFITRILKLKPLGKISQDLINTSYGILVHNTLEKFFVSINKYQNQEIEEQIDILQNLAKIEFENYNHDIIFYNTNYQKLVKALGHFIKQEQNNIKHILSSYLEIKGQYDLKITDTLSIKIASKVDRIDILDNNAILVTDYKTSAAKNKTYAMQLDINHYLIKHIGFKQLPKYPSNVTVNNRYIYLPKNKEISIYKEVNNPIDTYDSVLCSMLSKYYVDKQPFSFTDMYKQDTQEEYLHFARYLEWNTKIDIQHINDNEKEDE